MRNLLNFLAKYNNLIIFLILEGLALYFLSTGNTYQNIRLVKGFRGLTRGIEENVSKARSYFHLMEINQALASENTTLKKSIEQFNRKDNLLISEVTDTIFQQQYTFTSARVIDNSVNRQKNFFALDKGRKQGLAVDMAVTSNNRVAGVIIGCSENYSVAMSILNIDFKLSARIKSNGVFGSLSWDGRDYRQAILTEIPQHVTFAVGDTVETTGYSAVFPEGIIVGTVSNFKRSGSDFYTIDVSLLTDCKKLHYVTVIGNLKKKEQVELENKFQ